MGFKWDTPMIHHISSYFNPLKWDMIWYDGMHDDVCNLVIRHLYLDQSITMSLIKTCCGCEKKFGQAARKLLDQMQLGRRPPKSLHVSWPRWGVFGKELVFLQKIWYFTKNNWRGIGKITYSLVIQNSCGSYGVLSGTSLKFLMRELSKNCVVRFSVWPFLIAHPSRTGHAEIHRHSPAPKQPWTKLWISTSLLCRQKWWCTHNLCGFPRKPPYAVFVWSKHMHTLNRFPQLPGTFVFVYASIFGNVKVSSSAVRGAAATLHKCRIRLNLSTNRLSAFFQHIHPILVIPDFRSTPIGQSVFSTTCIQLEKAPTRRENSGANRPAS